MDIEKELNIIIEKGLKCLDNYYSYNQEQIDYIVKKATVGAINEHGSLAKLAIEETKRGVFEDKATKNMFASEYVQNNMKHLKTVGVISESNGIIEIAEPVGVICGITPVTNPTSTTIFKSLIALKTRNPIIFCFHPSAQQCSIAAAKVVRDAAIAAGAPEDCIQWVEHPSIQATNYLMNHDGIATILATGGNAMVKSAYSCGKPALGVGAGNVPAFIDNTANIAQAVYDIYLSKTFDNGMICASEQAVIVEQSIYNEVKNGFKKFAVHYATKDQKAKLENYMFGCKASSKDCSGAHLNAEIVGKPAYEIAKNAGFEIDKNVQLIIVEVKEVGINEPLTREKLSPVLAMLKADDTAHGIELSKQMVEFNGLGHSATIHSYNKETILEFGKQVNAIRLVNNAPSTFGAIGDVYNSFIPSLTLGCGSYGRNSVAGNVSAINLINVKKIGERKNNMQWFKIPSKIYFEKGSISYLKDAQNVENVFIVADRAMDSLGYIQEVRDILLSRKNKINLQVFLDVEQNPDITTVNKGVELMNSFKPDTIIALGGGSVMDAAKIMWLFYEKPEVDFNDLHQKFIDIRKRAFKPGELGKKAQLIAVPTTSGTGSEVTPFAVISDKANHKKYPLADYCLTPTVAILDPHFVEQLPKMVTAHTGLDVLTHAVESYVSILANDITDGIALHSIKLTFENLEKSVLVGDSISREKMHNASVLAGMSFANAFLGINHSLSHKLGGEFGITHGLANAILMPYVIRYNSTKPTKLSLWPKYTDFVADVRYQDIAKSLGLKATSPEEGVNNLIDAIVNLNINIGIESSFKELGIDEKEWLEKVDMIAELAFEDQCTPANPRLAMIDDMKQILIEAYYGNKA